MSYATATTMAPGDHIRFPIYNTSFFLQFNNFITHVVSENKIFEIPTIQTTQLAGSQDKFPNERKMTKSVVLFGPMIIEQNMEMRKYNGRSEDEDDGHEATTTIKNFKLLSSFRGLSENTFMISAVKIFNVCFSTHR